MFDAKMCELPLNVEFMAKVNYCNLGSQLHQAGVRDNDLIKCKMLSVDSDNPRVLFMLGAGDLIVFCDTEHAQSSIVYYGLTHE